MRKQDMRKVVVVTGGTAGVGRATARLFASRGADVAVLARGRERLDATAHELEALGARALAEPVDVADAAQVDRGIPLQSAYCASKHAIQGFMDSLRSELLHEKKPGYADRYLAASGFQSQQTDEPEPAQRPDNLWAPVPGDFGCHGRFDAKAKHGSPLLWMSRFRLPLALGVVGLSALSAFAGAFSLRRRRAFGR